ncbi:MAG: PD-(D/E)XK nuclease family protein [Chthoniobacterales bacterium]
MKQKVALQIASSPQEAWAGAIAPWFRTVLPDAWKDDLPTVVVVPTRTHAHSLKTRLLEQGQSHLGLQFVTPAGLRGLLGHGRDRPLPLREHLRLLLAIAAEQEDDGENLAAKAVVRAPDHLLRAIDRLETAGWDFDKVGPRPFLPIVKRFREQLRACDFSLAGSIDRELLARSSTEAPLFANLLLSAFDGGHWPYWFLLRAAIAAAQKATVVLEEPRGDLIEADLCWIGSWEQICGEGQHVSKPTKAFGDSLFSEAEMRGTALSPKRFDFLVGTNAADQAEAIAAQCARYLAEEKCTRLAVVFPGPGALPRLVGAVLAKRGIPHNDGFAHFLPGIFEAPEWQAWLDLQSGPRLESFLRFLNALPDPTILSAQISRSAFEKTLRESWSEVLLDDLGVLAEFCSRGDERSRATAEALRRLPFLPTRASLRDFLAATQSALTELGWKQHAFHIANLTRDWPAQINGRFSRALYLRWLRETAVTAAPGRAPAGDNPYARVQLLSVPEAQNQDFSHLILAGCNEGNWPPPPSAEFSRAEEIRTFNRSVQQLNKRAAQQGSQGEGHTAVRENHSLYLGPVEQRAIAVRQFDALIETATEAVALAAGLLQEDAPERLWNPSESLTQRYRAVRDEPLTQAKLKSWQRATTSWLDGNRRLLERSPAPRLAVQQTLAAFNARRDPEKGAGEYDYGLRPNESYGPVPILSVSDLEGMVTSPAIVWMKRYLGVEAADDTSNPWAATGGKWVHRWLAAIGEAAAGKLLAPFPSPSVIDERVEVSADERRTVLEQCCRATGKTIPDWWISGWLNARYLARHLGAKIAGAKDWKWMTTEYAFGRDGLVKVDDAVELQLRGRIDLILAQADAATFAGQKLWIVDYKTGGTKELKDSDLHDSLVKGTALQLGLYALALRGLGATEVGASILSSMVRKVAPQLFAADLAPHTGVFADLAEMQQTGVFGMKGELRAAFGYSAVYPLATLPIDQEILEDKWQHTHGNLVLEKDEWEQW